MKNWEIQISPGLFVSLALGLLVFPADWLVAWFIPTLVHEIFHLLALRLCRCYIYSIKIGAFGVQIYTDTPKGYLGALCALAGPVGGALLFVFWRYIPRVSLCALVQTAYNCIPIYPLDGGRALKGFLEGLFGAAKGTRIYTKAEKVFILLIWLLAVWGSVCLKLGVLPLVIGMLILMRNGGILKNSPCKQSILRVQ